MTSVCQKIKCFKKNCDNCKHAISSFKSVYCGKLKELANVIEQCPNFELEPAEYKLYRRM